jgi:hypothetical protein
MSPAEKAAREEMAERKMNTATEKAYSKSLTKTEEAPKSFGGKTGIESAAMEKAFKDDYKKFGSVNQPEDDQRQQGSIQAASRAARDEIKRETKGMAPKAYAKGGSVSSASSRADGCCTKGKTKGTMVKMKSGGMC